MNAGAESRDVVQLVVFAVGAEEYALDIMDTKEIINPPKVTPVPKAPAFVEGVVELRGAVIPIVDLRKRFDLEPTAPTRATKYLVVALAGRTVGLVVDAVREVLRVGRSELSPPPDLGADGRPGPFTAVCRREGRIILVLDLDGVLSGTEQRSLAGLAAECRGQG